MISKRALHMRIEELEAQLTALSAALHGVIGVSTFVDQSKLIPRHREMFITRLNEADAAIKRYWK